jgi:hypothetical protein
LRQRHICNKPLQGKQQAFEYQMANTPFKLIGWLDTNRVADIGGIGSDTALSSMREGFPVGARVRQWSGFCRRFAASVG